MRKFIFPDKKTLINQTAKLKTTNKLAMYLAGICVIGIACSFGFSGMSNAVVKNDENSLNTTAKEKLNIQVNENDRKPKSIAINSIPINENNNNIKNNNDISKILEQERIERLKFNDNSITTQYNNNDRYNTSPVIPIAGNINTNQVNNNDLQNADISNLNSLNANLKNIQNMQSHVNQELSNNQNMQQQKIDFNNKSGNFGYLNSVKQNAISEKEIKAGAVIPAILNNSLNSDLPGIVTATVSQDVYDSISHTNIVIPKGTKLNGIYDSNLSFGQDGLAVVWNRLVFSDGSTFDIGSMTGADQGGNSGFRDKVNNHYGRTFGSSILVALIGSGMQLSQPKGKTNTGNDAQETITANIAEQTGNTAQNVLNKTLNVQPTVTIRAGYRFNVMVNKDFIIE